jgi:hypothetical protein
LGVPKSFGLSVRLSQTCKSNNYIYNNNDFYKAKCELYRYQVDYKDPTNFIYIYNKKEIPFTAQGDHDLIEILKIYMLQFNMEKITCMYAGITSFPVYPKMTECDISNNELTSFPVQPVMTFCDISNNELTSFNIQPVMTYCDIDNEVFLENQPEIYIMKNRKA